MQGGSKLVNQFYKKFTNDLILSAIYYFLLTIRALIFLPIISKTLGSQGYGIWSIIMVTISLLQPVLSLNLSYGFTRFLPANKKNVSKTREDFLSVLITVSGWSLIIVMFLLVFERFFATLLFGSQEFIMFIRAIIILLPAIALILLFMDYYRSLRRMNVYVTLGALQIVLEVSSILIFIGLLHRSLIEAFNVFIMANYLILFIQVVLVLKEIGLSFPRFSHLKEYFKYSLPILPVRLSSWAVRSIDRYFIVLMVGLSAVGIYSASYAVAGMISLFMAPFSLILPPIVAELYDARDEITLNDTIFYSYKYVLFFSVPAAFGVFLVGDQVLLLITSSEFVEPLMTNLLMGIVAASITCMSVYVVFTPMIGAIKKTYLNTIFWTMSAMINISLNFLLIPSLGLIGAAVATLASYVVMMTAVLWVVSHHLTLTSRYLVILSKILVASVLMSLWLVFFRVMISTPETIGELMMQLFLEVLSAVGLYVFSMLGLLRFFDKKELRMLQSMVRRR